MTNILELEKPRKHLVGLDGKTQMDSEPRTVVQIFIKHKAAGPQATVQTFPILTAEVDGDINVIRKVLMGAMDAVIKKLAQLGVIGGITG